MEIVSEAPSIPETPTQSETRAIGELETPNDGSADREKGVERGQNDMENSECECKTATPDDEKTEEEQSAAVTETGQRLKFRAVEFPLNGTPNRLKLPKAFKFPERYSSPTDMMMSPISKGLLARTRKGALPSKMHELRIREMSLQS